MLQLVNLSNYKTDLHLIQHSSDCLGNFLAANGLDGVELMFCSPWDASVHRREWVHGAHLPFWPSWLDFWRGDRAELLRQFGSEEKIAACYGGLEREDWLNRYRDNIRLACQAGAAYLVFHVCHNRLEEIYDWRFSATDREVIEASIAMINELTDVIPPETTILFENLWWPGLTLLNREAASLLLDGVNHPNKGIMLDTGHLMNTNHSLHNETAAVDYVLRVLDKLGPLNRYIYGVHLHCSLSGSYIRQMQTKPRRQHSVTEAMSHVMQIDQHRPFWSNQAKRIIDWVQPNWLVHEFIQNSMADWQAKVAQQQQAIGLRRMQA